MPPKFDPNEIRIGIDLALLSFGLVFFLVRWWFMLLAAVYLRATGGEVGATSALAPKVGPLGLVRHCIRCVFFSCPFSSVSCTFFLLCSRRRRSVMTSPSQPKIGKACESLSSWPFRIDRQKSKLCQVHRRRSSRLWRNLHETGRSRRTVSWAHEGCFVTSFLYVAMLT